MSGFQPLIVVSGQKEQASDRRVEILRLNIGPAVSINVITPTVTITKSCQRLSNLTISNIIITTILGGLEGDVVLLLSGTMTKKLKLQPGVGISIPSVFEFKDFRTITLYRNATGWEQIARS